MVFSTVCSGADQEKTAKLRVTGFCEENPPMTCGFPSQKASNAENVSIGWRHHDYDLVDMRFPSSNNYEDPTRSQIPHVTTADCRDICKNVIWSDRRRRNKRKINFQRIWIICLWTLHDIGHQPISDMRGCQNRYVARWHEVNISFYQTKTKGVSLN